MYKEAIINDNWDKLKELSICQNEFIMIILVKKIRKTWTLLSLT